MDCQHDGFEKLFNNDAREASRVDGAMFLKASLRGVERKRGGLGGQPPAICKHKSRVLKGSIYGFGRRSPTICK